MKHDLQHFYNCHDLPRYFDHAEYLRCYPWSCNLLKTLDHVNYKQFDDAHKLYYHYKNFLKKEAVHHQPNLLFIRATGVDHDHVLYFLGNDAYTSTNKHANFLELDVIHQKDLAQVFTSNYRQLDESLQDRATSHVSLDHIHNVVDTFANGSNFKSFQYNNRIYNHVEISNIYSFLLDVTKINCDKILIENVTIELYDHQPTYITTETPQSYIDGRWSFENKPQFKTKPTAQDTTIITISSPFEGMPNVKYLANSLRSIKQFSELHNSPSIVIFDGIKPGSKWDTPANIRKYERYKHVVKQSCLIDKYPFNNTAFVESTQWNGPSRNVQTGLDLTSTDLVMINQHDLELYNKDVSIWDFSHDLVVDYISKTHDALADDNNVNCVVFPRMWDLHGRWDFMLDGIKHKVDYKNPPTTQEIEYHTLEKDMHPSEEDIKHGTHGVNWYRYTDRDYTCGDFKLYNIKGFSDAPVWTRTDFFNNLMGYARNGNMDRFLEDQIHAALKTHDMSNITDNIFIFPLFTCRHVDLKSKSSYLGRAMDDY